MISVGHLCYLYRACGVEEDRLSTRRSDKSCSHKILLFVHPCMHPSIHCSQHMSVECLSCVSGTVSGSVGSGMTKGAQASPPVSARLEHLADIKRVHTLNTCVVTMMPKCVGAWCWDVGRVKSKRTRLGTVGRPPHQCDLILHLTAAAPIHSLLVWGRGWMLGLSHPL